jgi:hypothetical protein
MERDVGIFDKIKGAIFGHATAAPMPTAQQSAAPTPASTAAPTASPTPAAKTAAPAAPAASDAPAVDVSAILTQAVAAKGQKLDWKRSIVDLMKALDLDSSLTARKELAKELHYTGDTNDSATMNVWLHKALMKKLAEHGGKIPADLLD